MIDDGLDQPTQSDDSRAGGSRARTALQLRALPRLLAPSVREGADFVARASLGFRSIWGHTDYSKYIVLGIARTGSSLLIDLLAAHAHAIAFGEIFRSTDVIGWDLRPYASLREKKIVRLYREQPVAFLQKSIFTRWPRNIDAVGFKLFYYHARKHPHSAIWDFLRDDQTIRIVHVKRRNILAQLLSLRIAHQTNVWSLKREVTAPAPMIRLNVGECREHFESVRRFECDGAAHFSGHPISDVYYEDLVKNRDGVLAVVQNFLGLERRSTQTTLARQRRRPLSESIANFAELRRAFDGSPWSEFFNDDE